MTSVESTTSSFDQSDVNYYQYKSMSTSAILAISLGGLSLLAIYSQSFLLLPVIGVMVSVYAIVSTSSQQEELSGLKLAKLALGVNGIVLLGAFGFHTYIYFTEVPDGYQRVTFAQLQPARSDRGPVPNSAIELNGQKVFIKGYTYPGEKRRNLTSFVMVPDIGSCCFGGQPKLTDMIEVTLDEPLKANYSLRCRKLTGVFKVDNRLKPVTGLGGVYYRLQADGIK